MQFISLGLQSSFRDLGRFGHQAKGINPDGAMDIRTVRLLNILLQNDENEGVLEMHFPAPQLLFEESAVIAIGGADFNAEVDGQPVPLGKMTEVSAGSCLRFTKKNRGERAYLAVKGGFALEKWLDSVSLNSALGMPNAVEKGKSVALKAAFSPPQKMLWLGSLRPTASPEVTVRFVRGTEFDFLTDKGKSVLTENPYLIQPTSNRMGYRLEGKPLQTLAYQNILTSAVTFGTMQLLPDGQLIVLMAGHQTTGGYPRVGNVIAVDLPLLAQAGSSQKIHFQEVSIAEAQRLHIEREQFFVRLKSCLNIVI